MTETLEEIKPKKLTKRQRFMEFLMEMDKLMAENPLSEIPMGHDFCDKMYIRSIFIPAGAALTSKIHLTEHPYELSMGEIIIAEPSGLTTLKAPYRGITKKGSIRCGFAITDSLWSTYHYNEDNCRDLNIVENRIFKDYNINRK